MTWSIIKLGLMLYLIFGIELAEWSLHQPDRRHQPRQTDPGKDYLLMVFVGPLLVLKVSFYTLLIAIHDRLIWRQYLALDAHNNFWAIAATIAIIVVIALMLPLRS
ncbi:MAG: hypothetical protein ACR2QH_00185 [Geminicoccaceae bacterium]